MFDGAWLDDTKTGIGRLVTSSGILYTGIWKNNALSFFFVKNSFFLPVLLIWFVLILFENIVAMEVELKSISLRAPPKKSFLKLAMLLKVLFFLNLYIVSSSFTYNFNE